MAEAYTASSHAGRDNVSRERRYLAFIETPTLAAVREFVAANFINGDSLQFAAAIDDLVVGWCDTLVNTLARIFPRWEIKHGHPAQLS